MIGFDNFRYPQLERVWKEVFKDYFQEDLQTMLLIVQITATLMGHGMQLLRTMNMLTCQGPSPTLEFCCDKKRRPLKLESAEIPHTKPTDDKIKIQQQWKDIALTLVSCRDLLGVLEMESTPLMGCFVTQATCELQDSEALSEARCLSVEGIFLPGVDIRDFFTVWATIRTRDSWQQFWAWEKELMSVPSGERREKNSSSLEQSYRLVTLTRIYFPCAFCPGLS